MWLIQIPISCIVTAVWIKQGAEGVQPSINDRGEVNGARIMLPHGKASQGGLMMYQRSPRSNQCTGSGAHIARDK